MITPHTRHPLIIAHRGSSGSAPENTIAAFRLAIEQDADMIELDVRMTKDFHIVVHHDRDVRRTTNAKGCIWDLTLNQIRLLDAGSWYSQKFKGEQIPTLRQVLEMMPPHMRVNIEAKTDGDPRKRLAFEESCILIIMEKRFEERVLVSSFDHKFLARMHNLFPAIKTGALYYPVRDVAKKPSTIVSKTGASAFICSHTQLWKRFIQDAHEHKIMLATYVINTKEQLEKVMRQGVDAVITDFPGKMRSTISNI